MIERSERVYRRARDGATAKSLYTLVKGDTWRFDSLGVSAAFGETDMCHASCVQGIEFAPTQPSFPFTATQLAEALALACSQLPAGRIALALSGGLDSAVLLALLRGRATAYTLASSLGNYDESAQALATARALGVTVRVVKADAEDFVQHLPEVVRYAETPLYNLHPVGRWLLARQVRADGFDHLVTGDGADQILANVSGADYLPIVAALTRAAGLTWVPPFLAACLEALRGRDPGKRALRALALDLGVPKALVERPKRPTYTPALNIDRHFDKHRLSDIAQQLRRPIELTDDRARVSWTTLGLLAKVLDACAA